MCPGLASRRGWRDRRCSVWLVAHFVCVLAVSGGCVPEVGHTGSCRILCHLSRQTPSLVVRVEGPTARDSQLRGSGLQGLSGHLSLRGQGGLWRQTAFLGKSWR